VTTFPDYSRRAYFRVFAAPHQHPNWRGPIIDRNYTILANVTGNLGLVPGPHDGRYHAGRGSYGYDACRTPWRIAMDYCFNGEARAQAYLAKVGPFFNGVGAANIVDGYSATGSPAGSGNKNMAFIGPAGVAAWRGFQSLLDGAFMFGVNNTANDYFKDSLRVVTM